MYQTFHLGQTAVLMTSVVRFRARNTNNNFKNTSSGFCRHIHKFWKIKDKMVNLRIKPILFGFCFLLLLHVLVKTFVKGKPIKFHYFIIIFTRKGLGLGSRSYLGWKRHSWGSKLRTLFITSLHASFKDASFALLLGQFQKPTFVWKWDRETA